jgi:hypothetical protein
VWVLGRETVKRQMAFRFVKWVKDTGAVI